MKPINFYADIFSQTGYSSHSRQLLNALYKLNSSIFLDTPKPIDWLRASNTAEMNMINAQPFKKAVNIAVTLPPFYQQYLSDRNPFIGWCVWEGTHVPKYWIETFKRENLKHIIVPSEHVKQAIINTFPDEHELFRKISIIPHGVNLNIFKPNPSARQSKFTFIANKGWAQGINDRGGIQWLLKAFCDEFRKDNDVELLLKINVAYCPPNWNLVNELTKLGLTPEDTKNVKFIPQNIDYSQLAEIYQKGHVFVSPTMGEAFNLGCLESMACGLPVITTGFGGQTDYVNKENGWLIEYDLFDVTWDINYENCKWAMPNLKDLREKMRNAYDLFKNGNNEFLIKSNLAIQTASQYSWENSAKQLMALINEIDN